MLRSVSPLNTVLTRPASLVLFGWAMRLGRQLGVGLATGHVGDVHGDEVVSVGLGLLAGEQLLARRTATPTGS